MRFLFACILVLALMSAACEAVPDNNQGTNQGQPDNQKQQNDNGGKRSKEGHRMLHF
ncbi:hypothetical protein TNCT_22301, partial [Trichonephila clavata]